MPHRDRDDPRNTALLLAAAYRAYLARLTEGVARAGYPGIRAVHGGNVFAHLRAGGSRLTELAARAGMANQSMSYLVDYLAARGHVERVPDPTDARAKVIRRTERGWASERAGAATIARLEAAAARRLGARELRELRRLLVTLTAALEDEAGHPDDAA
jgi:DNA-binding MarR family transcriptional regulator